LSTGSSAASAGCEARSAEYPADGNTRRLLPGARSVRQQRRAHLPLWSACLPLPDGRQAGTGRLAEYLSATGQSGQMKRLVSPLIVHNKAAGRYSRKYKPIEINNAMYPIARNFVVNIAVLFAPSCVIYNL